MIQPPSILLVAGEELEARVRAALPELNGNLSRFGTTPSDVYVRWQVSDLLAAEPSVIAFGPELPVESVLELATELDRLNPEIEVLLISPPTPKVWERAARCGIREVVSPASDDDLALAIRRTMETVASRRLASAASGASQDERRSLIVVRSPKGGSGKTMVASNLAVTLARRFPGEVVIVDLDLQFGDAATALGLEPNYTIGDATANAELTPTTLKTLLAAHRSSLHALCAPARPDEASPITADDVTALLTLLQAAFRFVVVDTAAGTDARVEAALSAATDIVLVCSMDVSSVRSIRKDLEQQDPARLEGVKHHVVLNRADSRVALEVRDIEATIGRRIDVRVGSSRLVPLHMNCGVPVVEAEPRSTVADQLRQLADRLAPIPASTRKRRRR